MKDIGTAMYTHTISIVIPVYKGEASIEGVVDEIVQTFADTAASPKGNKVFLQEIILALDSGPDNSDQVARKLAGTNEKVKPIWLSRNYGQHAATIAGIASSSADWVVTMDEDGQHNPLDILHMLDTAISEQAQLIYAKPLNPAPHSFIRNYSSRLAKKILATVSGNPRVADIQSFRLIIGNVARSMAAYAGSGVYLDVALYWVIGKSSTTNVLLRAGSGRPSGYSRFGLISHFMRMLLTSGTRGLRLVTFLGSLFAVSGLLLGLYIFISSFIGHGLPSGWPSITVICLFGFGTILLSLGIIAEYLGLAVNMAMGKPPYLLTSDPLNGPLGANNKDSK